MASVMARRPGMESMDPKRYRGEPRWPASLAIVAAIGLYVTLPEKLTLGPGWLMPALEAALVASLTLASPYRLRGEQGLIRWASLLLIGLVNATNVASLALLVHLV